MERNFDNRDFEQFLKTNADQYKMYPSEKVWDEINTSLHPRRRWTGIAALLLLITGAIVSSVMVLSPGSSNNEIAQQPQSGNITSTESPKTTPEIKATKPVSVLRVVAADKPIASNRIPSIIHDNLPIITSNTEEAIVQSADFITTAQPEIQKTERITEVVAENRPEVKSKSYFPTQVTAEQPATFTNNFETATEKQIKAEPVKQNSFSLAAAKLDSKPSPVAKKKFEKKHIEFQLYFTPGVTYRRLSENKEAILAASGSPSIPTNLALQDVKNVVTHKPDVGFELGLAARYPLSKRILVKTGLQFNVNKYDIRAFSYSGEPATIAIQGNNNQQTITSTSYYRNSSGYRPNWLTNVYFSLSVPVGAEVKILDGKKLDLGIGLTAQPTYLLDNRAYLLSTDFKNYVKVPDLMRRWNMNAGAEIIVDIKTKRTNWQIGPQVRYQTLSSFKNKYPVIENLFTFGLKAGVMLH
jgi:Outer membrane protein beta-barrel domain